MADIWNRSNYIVQFMFKASNKAAVYSLRLHFFDFTMVVQLVRYFVSFLIRYSSLHSWLPITAPRCRLTFTVMLIFVFSNNFSTSFTSWGFTINQHLLASGLQPNFGPKLHKAFHHSWYYLVIHQLINCLQAQPFSFVCSEIFLLVPITSLLAVLSRLRTLSLLSDHLDFVPSCDVISALPITKSRDSKL